MKSILTNKQLEKYGRQIILPEIGEAGQEALLRAKALIIGCGGLGSSSALYLAGAGLDHIGLVDSDKVELNNLHRQIIYTAKDIGKQKAETSGRRLKALNPDLKIETRHSRVDSKNIRGLIKDYDFIIDCTDNFPSHYLINDACVLSGKPLSHAGVLGFKGQTMTIIPGKSPCFRCVFPEPPEEGKVGTCLDSGVLGTVPGMLGTLQATEAIKHIIGKGKLLTGKLLFVDLLNMNIRIIPIKKNRNCICMGLKNKQ